MRSQGKRFGLSGFIRTAALLAVPGAAVIQVIPLYPRTNPPVVAERTLETHLEVAAPVKAILDRSCRDCHSNATQWPWYSAIAPVSWLVARDVHKARSIMNFSDWSEGANQKLDKAITMLAASCTDVKVGRMPKPEYVFMHSRAALSETDVAEFCSWTKAEGKRLVLLKKRR